MRLKTGSIMRALKISLVLLALSLSAVRSDEAVRAAPQATPSATLAVTMSDPTCVQAAAVPGACYIVIRSINASASDTSYTGLDIAIDGKVRARIQPFFETTTYLNDRMLGRGLMVTCGRPNASGDPNYGRQYQVSYAGYLIGSSTPAVSGSASVFCPAYESKVYTPLVRK